MKIEQYLPADTLKPFIKTFMIIESENGMENKILPDTSIVMAFRCKGKVTYVEDGIENVLPLSVVTGLRRSARFINYSTKSATLLVIFREGGAGAFFNGPLHELYGISVSLDNLIQPERLTAVEDQLAEAVSNLQRIAIAERFLLSQMQNTPHDILVLHAIQKMKAAEGDIRIKELLADLPISRDSFEKRFRKAIGNSPKQFCTTLRLRSLINGYSKAGSLTRAAHAAGYFDQSHFIRDFKSFTGQTPKDFFKSSSYW